jgi:hypothetical protein
MLRNVFIQQLQHFLHSISATFTDKQIRLHTHTHARTHTHTHSRTHTHYRYTDGKDGTGSRAQFIFFLTEETNVSHSLCATFRIEIENYETID